MIIGRRELIIDRDTNPVTVAVTIEAPVFVEGRWRCDFEIGWPDKPYRRCASGFGSMAAIINTTKRIALELYGSAYHTSGRLWLDDGGGYGFPLPGHARSLAVGHDVEY